MMPDYLFYILWFRKVLANKYVLIWIFFGIGIVIFPFIYQHLLSTSLLCSDTDIRTNVIPKLCQDVNVSHSEIFSFPNDNEKFPISVNLCSVLCDYKFDISCHKFHLNKEIVFTINYSTIDNPQQIVVKSIIVLEDADAYWNQKSASPYIPTSDELRSMVDTYITSFIGQNSDGLLSDIKSYLFLFKVVDLKVHEEFWKFIYDHEFLTSYLFSNFGVFPKIVGTCQNFYGVEYAKPLIENPIWPIYIPSNEVINKSIELLRFMDKLQTMWYEPIHLCDVKHDHFGWKMDGAIFFLDLDCVETDSSLKTIMHSMPECSNNDDCSYFDCHGYCLPSHHCSGNRVNTNLQILCSKIFLGYSDSSVFAMSGLLLNFHNSKELQEALELCAVDPAATTSSLIEILRELLNLPHYADL